jgi:hypothetical protein
MIPHHKLVKWSNFTNLFLNIFFITNKMVKSQIRKSKSVRKSKAKRKSVRKSKAKRKSVRKSKAKRKSVRKSRGRSTGKLNAAKKRIRSARKNQPLYAMVIRMDARRRVPIRTKNGKYIIDKVNLKTKKRVSTKYVNKI